MHGAILVHGAIVDIFTQLIYDVLSIGRADMDVLPKITAVITIVETNEVHHVEFEDVNMMLISLTYNVGLAETVLDRSIRILPPDIDGDICKIKFVYADTNQPYMTVVATKYEDD